MNPTMRDQTLEALLSRRREINRDWKDFRQPINLKDLAQIQWLIRYVTVEVN